MGVIEAIPRVDTVNKADKIPLYGNRSLTWRDIEQDHSLIRGVLGMTIRALRDPGLIQRLPEELQEYVPAIINGDTSRETTEAAVRVVQMVLSW